MSIDRTWECKNCDAGFWKDSSGKRSNVGELVPWQWPQEEKTEK